MTREAIDIKLGRLVSLSERPLAAKENNSLRGGYFYIHNTNKVILYQLILQR